MIPADLSWHGEGYPELRDGPPWVMEEMIEAEAGLAEPIAAAAGADAIAAAVTRAASAGEPIVVTGCGTSEHGAWRLPRCSARRCARRARARCRSRARRSMPRSIRVRGGVCIGISHDGTTRATILRARLGARGRGGDRDDRRARRLADRRPPRSRRS